MCLNSCPALNWWLLLVLFCRMTSLSSVRDRFCRWIFDFLERRLLWWPDDVLIIPSLFSSSIDESEAEYDLRNSSLDLNPESLGGKWVPCDSAEDLLLSLRASDDAYLSFEATEYFSGGEHGRDRDLLICWPFVFV